MASQIGGKGLIKDKEILIHDWLLILTEIKATVAMQCKVEPYYIIHCNIAQKSWVCKAAEFLTLTRFEPFRSFATT